MPESLAELIPTTAALAERLDEAGYLTDLGLATALFCAVRLPQPLLLEGEAGVGKTEAAKSLAAMLDTPLIRLQCFEGITASEALYEWNYQRQLLAIRLSEATTASGGLDGLGGPSGSTGIPSSAGSSGGRSEASLFTADYLVERPLLQALRHPGPRPAVLLIDEIDRADDEFEAFLFEMLAESAVTIPELGTIKATHPPVVILTSNRTRDLHDALKRRCLYHWIDYPPLDRATAIIRRRVPAARAALADQVAGAVGRLRSLDVQKQPGVAEAIGWVSALQMLGIETLDADATRLTLGSVLKYREDADVAIDRGLDWVASGARG